MTNFPLEDVLLSGGTDKNILMYITIKESLYTNSRLVTEVHKLYSELSLQQQFTM